MSTNWSAIAFAFGVTFLILFPSPRYIDKKTYS